MIAAAEPMELNARKNYAAERKRLGLCVCCRTRAIVGQTRCEKHAREAREAQRIRNIPIKAARAERARLKDEARIAAGLVVRRLRPAPEGCTPIQCKPFRTLAETEVMQRLDCPRRSVCIDYASDMGWRAMTCQHCGVRETAPRYVAFGRNSMATASLVLPKPQ